MRPSRRETSYGADHAKRDARMADGSVARRNLQDEGIDLFGRQRPPPEATPELGDASVPAVGGGSRPRHAVAPIALSFGRRAGHELPGLVGDIQPGTDLRLGMHGIERLGHIAPDVARVARHDIVVGLIVVVDIVALVGKARWKHRLEGTKKLSLGQPPNALAIGTTRGGAAALGDHREVGHVGGDGIHRPGLGWLVDRQSAPCKAAQSGLSPGHVHAARLSRITRRPEPEAFPPTLPFDPSKSRRRESAPLRSFAAGQDAWGSFRLPTGDSQLGSQPSRVPRAPSSETAEGGFPMSFVLHGGAPGVAATGLDPRERPRQALIGPGSHRTAPALRRRSNAEAGAGPRWRAIARPASFQATIAAACGRGEWPGQLFSRPSKIVGLRKKRSRGGTLFDRCVGSMRLTFDRSNNRRSHMRHGR